MLSTSHVLAGGVTASLLAAVPSLGQDNGALPEVQGKAGPAIEALHSCTSQAKQGNMAEASKRAFIMECVNGNLAAGPPRQAGPSQQQTADCEAVAAYLELSGTDRSNFVTGCIDPHA
jgi:hypothetical protein